MTERRGWPARVGFALLSLLFPGSAHLALGRATRGAIQFGLFAALIVATKAHAWIVADWTFTAWLILAGMTVTAALVALASAVLAWSDSRERSPIPPSRWFACGAAVLVLLGLNVAPPAIEDSIENYSIPSESMLPSLMVGDRLVAQRRALGPLAPGAVIVVTDARGEARIVRVVARAGQTVALRGGRAVIDGVPAPLSATTDPQVWRERLPGEAGDHPIRDDGVTRGDEFGPVTVPAGHVFVLGDNRDNSADSRFSAEDFGLGMVPESAVVGRARFLYWSHDRSRIGRAL